MANDDEWTPYGLEAIRQAHLMRRRILGLIAILAVLGLGALGVETTTTERLSISANGNEVTDSVSIPEPEKPPQNNKVTVSLQPGRVARVESGNAPDGPQVETGSMPPAVRAAPYPWKLWAMKAMPWLLAGSVAYLLAKRRGKHDQVNYGIYKGSMPLETITAHHHGAVFTKRNTKTAVFGKRRTDYLPPELEQRREG